MTITRVLSHPIIILALTILSIAFFFSLEKSGEKTQNSAENIRILEYEVNQISHEIIAVEERLNETESQQFKEKVVRNELLLQKPGEYVIQIAQQTQTQIQPNCNSNHCDTDVLVKKNPLDSWKALLY